MFRPAQAETSDAYFEYVSESPDEEEGQQDRRRGGLLGSPRSGAPRNRAARASTGAADRRVTRVRSVAQCADTSRSARSSGAWTGFAAAACSPSRIGIAAFTRNVKTRPPTPNTPSVTQTSVHVGQYS